MKPLYSLQAIEVQIDIKKATLETLDYQIKSLKNFTSPVQLKIWRKTRASINKELKELKIRYDLLQK